MSEFGAGGTEEHNHQDMTSAMELSDRNIKDLRRLQPASWVYWQAVEDEGAKNNWGFIHSEFKAGESYEITKQYYAMAHFSKFIRPGSYIILTDSDCSVAAYDKEQKRLTVVATNNTVDVQELEYDLSAFDFETQSVNVYQTSAEKDLEKSELKIYSNGFGFEVEENSITTIIIDDVKKKDSILFQKLKCSHNFTRLTSICVFL